MCLKKSVGLSSGGELCPSSLKFGEGGNGERKKGQGRKKNFAVLAGEERNWPEAAQQFPEFLRDFLLFLCISTTGIWMETSFRICSAWENKRHLFFLDVFFLSLTPSFHACTHSFHQKIFLHSFLFFFSFAFLESLQHWSLLFCKMSIRACSSRIRRKKSFLNAFSAFFGGVRDRGNISQLQHFKNIFTHNRVQKRVDHDSSHDLAARAERRRRAAIEAAEAAEAPPPSPPSPTLASVVVSSGKMPTLRKKEIIINLLAEHTYASQLDLSTGVKK